MRMKGRTVMAGSAALVMAVGVSACNKGLQAKTLHVNEKDTNNFGFADNPPKAKVGPNGPDMLTNGDSITFSNDIVDAAGKNVGDLQATCVTTRKGGFDHAGVTCHGTFTLPKGQLFVAVGGLHAFGNKGTIGAVVGGTGDYAGATGTFSGSNGKNAKDTFKLFLPK